MATRHDRPDLAVPPPPVPASEPESLIPAVALAPPAAAPPDAAEDGPEPADERVFALSRSRDTDKLTAYIDLALFGQLEEQVAKARYRHRKRKPLIGHVYDAVIAVGLAHMDEVDKMLRGLR